MVTNEDVLGNLIPALSQTFCIILTGFVSYEAFGPKGQRALELLVTRYALPCVVMVGIAGIDLTRVNWTFVLAVFIAKTVTFAVTVAATLTTASREGDQAPEQAARGIGAAAHASYQRRMAMKKAAIRGMFTTLSNDFALGVPIFNALFRPEFTSYIYLVAPITLVLLNPIAFVIIEMNKIGPEEEEGAEDGEEDGEGDMPTSVKVIVENQSEGCDYTRVMIQTEFAPRATRTPPRSSSMPSLTALAAASSTQRSSSWGRIVQKTVRVLDSMSLNVIYASIHNDPDGNALDVLHVQRDGGGQIIGEDELELREVLEGVISGRTPLRRVLGRQQQQQQQRIEHADAVVAAQPSQPECTSGAHRRVASADELSGDVFDAPFSLNDGSYSRRGASVAQEGGLDDGERTGSFARIFINVLITPVVAMALIGVMVNLLETHGNVEIIPKVVLMPLQNMGDAYSALALFALGLSLASLKAIAPKDGDGGSAGGSALIPFSVAEVRLVSFLVAMKSLLVPYLCMQVCYIFSGDSDIGVAAFVYGMLPTAPSVSLFASIHRVANDVKIIPAATLVGTCVMPPLVYLGARLMMVAVTSASDMAFYLSVIDESISVLGVLESVAALWTLLAFVFTSIFSRSQMKRRLLGHAAFWMLACGVVDVVSARLDRKYVRGDLPYGMLSRGGLALNLVRYGAAIVSRMLVSASVISVVLSYDAPGDRPSSRLSYFSPFRQNRGATYGKLRSQLDSEEGGGATTTTALLSDADDGSEVRRAFVGYAERPLRGKWPNFVALELGLHVGSICIGALAILITMVGGGIAEPSSPSDNQPMSKDVLDAESSFRYGLCWPWLVLNPAQVIIAAVLGTSKK